MKIKKSTSFTLMIIILFLAHVKAEEKVEVKGERIIKTLPGIIKPVILIIEFYQNHLGRIKGSYCVMYPSCSEYGRLTIEKNGYIGILKTFDRLHRCSHDLDNYEIIFVDNEVRYLDESY